MMSPTDPQEHNPYQPPRVQMGGAGSDGYRPQNGTVGTLTVLFSIDIVCQLFLGTFNLVELTVMPDVAALAAAGDPSSFVFSLVEALVGLLSVGATIALVVMFCVWVYRANRHARVLSGNVLEFTPGWAVGWFFVPFANLYKPYQAVKEIYIYSEPRSGDDSSTGPLVPGLLPAWWGFWLASNFASNIEFRLSWTDDPAMMNAGLWAGVLATPLAVAAAVLAMLVVRRIHDRQKRLARDQGML